MASMRKTEGPTITYRGIEIQLVQAHRYEGYEQTSYLRWFAIWPNGYAADTVQEHALAFAREIIDRQLSIST